MLGLELNYYHWVAVSVFLKFLNTNCLCADVNIAILLRSISLQLIVVKLFIISKITIGCLGVVQK